MRNKVKVTCLILLAVILAVALVACNGDTESGKIPVRGIIGISEVDINADTKTISTTVTNQLAYLDLDRIQVDTGIELSAYQDEECKIAVSRLEFAEGINIYYLKFAKGAASDVWKIAVTQLPASRIEELLSGIAVADTFVKSYEVDDTINQADIVLLFKDGTKKNAVTTEIAGFYTSVPGIKNITLTFKSFSTTVEITVTEGAPKEVKSYEINYFPPNFAKNDPLPEIKIKVNYTDGSFKYIPVTIDMVTGFDTSEVAANKSVRITYNDSVFDFVYNVIATAEDNADFKDFVNRVTSIAYDAARILYPDDYNEVFKQFLNVKLIDSVDEVNKYFEFFDVKAPEVEAVLTAAEKLLTSVKIEPLSGTSSISEFIEANVTVGNIAAIQTAVKEISSAADVYGRGVYYVLLPLLKDQAFQPQSIYLNYDTVLVDAALKSLGNEEISEFIENKVDYKMNYPLWSAGDYVQELINGKECGDLINSIESLFNAFLDTPADDIYDSIQFGKTMISSLSDGGDIMDFLKLSIDDLSNMLGIVGDLIIRLSEVNYKPFTDLTLKFYDNFFDEFEMQIGTEITGEIYRSIISNLNEYMQSFLRILGNGIKNLGSADILNFIDAVKNYIDAAEADKDAMLGKIIALSADKVMDMINAATPADRTSFERMLVEADNIITENINGFVGEAGTEGLLAKYYKLVKSISEQYDYDTISKENASKLPDEFVKVTDEFIGGVGETGTRKMEIFLNNYSDKSNFIFPKGYTATQFYDHLNTVGVSYGPLYGSRENAVPILIDNTNTTGFNSSKTGKFKFQIEVDGDIQVFEYYIYDTEAIAGSKITRYPNIKADSYNSDETDQYFIGSPMPDMLYINGEIQYAVPSIGYFLNSYSYYGENESVAVNEANLFGFVTAEAGSHVAFILYNHKILGDIYIPYFYTVRDNSAPTPSSVDRITIIYASKVIKGGDWRATLNVYNEAGSSTTIDVNADGVTVSGFESNVLGSQLVTVTYGGKKAFAYVEVVSEETAETVTDITAYLNKTVYKAGEKFDKNGLALNVTYGDGYRTDTLYYGDPEFSDVMIIFDSSLPENVDKLTKKVTINYSGLTYEREVTVVSEALSNKITSIEPINYYYSNNNIFIIGDTVTPEKLGMLNDRNWYLTVIYGYGYSGEEINYSTENFATDLKIVGFDNTKAGDYRCYFEYKGHKALYGYFDLTFITEAYSNTPTSIIVNLYKQIYKIGDELGEFSINVTFGGGYREEYIYQSELAGVNVTGFDNTAPGWQLVKFEYAGLTALKLVKVISAEYAETVTSFNLDPSMPIIAVGDTAAQLAAKLTYENLTFGGGYLYQAYRGTIGDILTADYNIDAFDSSSVGIKRAKLTVGASARYFYYRVIGEVEKEKVTAIKSTSLDGESINVADLPQTITVCVEKGYGYAEESVEVPMSEINLDTTQSGTVSFNLTLEGVTYTNTVYLYQ